MTDKDDLKRAKLALERQKQEFETQVTTNTHELEKLRIRIAAIAILAPIVATVLTIGFGFLTQQEDRELRRLDVGNKFEISLVKALAEGNHKEILRVGDSLYVEQGDAKSAAWWCDVGNAYKDYVSDACSKPAVKRQLEVEHKKKWYLENDW